MGPGFGLVKLPAIRGEANHVGDELPTIDTELEGLVSGTMMFAFSHCHLFVSEDGLYVLHPK